MAERENSLELGIMEEKEREQGRRQWNVGPVMVIKFGLSLDLS